MTNDSNIRKSLSISNISCRVNNPDDEIFDLIDVSKKGDLYKIFVSNFLKYIPVDYRSKNKMKLFGDFTKEAFDFFTHKPHPDNCKIDIHTNECQNNPSITILITSDIADWITKPLLLSMNDIELLSKALITRPLFLNSS